MKLLLATLLYLHSLSLSKQAADRCDSATCIIDQNCRCSNLASPLSLEETPQFITLSFAEAVVDNVYSDLWSTLLFDRTNPDGNPISATFFVPHEYTDYSDVHALYARGFEIGVNSITKNSTDSYWRTASQDTLQNEFGGQRKIISYFANISIDDIVGAQTPMLQIEGDRLIDAYVEGGIQYDNSWTSPSNLPLFPYSLDYRSTQQCRSDTECPEESHPNFWILPINDIRGDNNIECNALAGCNVFGTPDEIAGWLLEQVERVRSSKTPLTLLVPSSWFRIVPNSFEGFTKFLDSLRDDYTDVFLVSQKQLLDWIKNPVSLTDFKTNTVTRSPQCTKINCALLNSSGSTRYMMSCVPCPHVYPWIGNPMGDG